MSPIIPPVHLSLPPSISLSSPLPSLSLTPSPFLPPCRVVSVNSAIVQLLWGQRRRVIYGYRNKNVKDKFVPLDILCQRLVGNRISLYQDTSINRTPPSVANAIFVCLITSEMSTPHYSGHVNLTQ